MYLKLAASVAALGLGLIGTPGLTNAPTRAHHHDQIFNVTKGPYHVVVSPVCLPSSPDQSRGVQNAINAAQSGPGNTVYFPAGDYCLARPIKVKGQGGNNGIVITGPTTTTLGAPTTARTASAALVDTSNGTGTYSQRSTYHASNLLYVESNNVTVQDLVLDSQTLGCNQLDPPTSRCNLGGAIAVRASHTVLQHVRALTPLPGFDYTGLFPVYYSGPARDNSIDDLTLNDGICDDSFVFAFQTDGTVTDVRETGAHLALYEDEDIAINGYTFTPGIEAPLCPNRINGYYISGPASNITIDNYTLTNSDLAMSGGGNISTTSAVEGKTPRRISCVVIKNEKLAGLGGHIELDEAQPPTISRPDCSNALPGGPTRFGAFIDGGSLGSNGWIAMYPHFVTGSVGDFLEKLDTVYIENMASLPQVTFVSTPSSTGRNVSKLDLVNNKYPGFTPLSGVQEPSTFTDITGAAVNFLVNGGTWTPPSGIGSSFWMAGSTPKQTKCTVTHLSGYSGPSDPC